MVDIQLASKWIQAVAWGVAASSAAIGYSEIMFLGTRYLYKTGRLQRYYPLPKERGVFTAWTNAMSFTIPTAVYAIVYRTGSISTDFSIFKMAAYMFLYMLIHDAFFYWCHRTFHVYRFLYDRLHAMHHEYSYAMHVYIVGHAEIIENFLQVGVPWLTWTAIAGHNLWYWLVPFSFVLFSTLIGHSGYRSNAWLLVFHPLALPSAAASGSLMLTVADHQMHHSHRRVNFGLFWRFWDKHMGTYRKCETRAHDFAFWKKWAESEKTKEHDAQARTWLGKNQVEFHEVEWGF
jgi:sterol desaturase/sphingolipid hydroxylase (fatty acid hydroxylase superfamily)